MLGDCGLRQLDQASMRAHTVEEIPAQLIV